MRGCEKISAMRMKLCSPAHKGVVADRPARWDRVLRANALEQSDPNLVKRGLCRCSRLYPVLME
ncbi:hypothetical protein BN2475_310141 [Paraburkholderia ribeironis]|uniref:Uncharacterized protein n=1 Tax=Paraburkholderia ribeironis TaxID=1247936 RepID=A0A1N7S2U4_9BURK|nr:hypothetical protein BN2475_310141 [Paraburkholderia ribeironis]